MYIFLPIKRLYYVLSCGCTLLFEFNNIVKKMSINLNRIKYRWIVMQVGNLEAGIYYILKHNV